jgi:hypothetical protein
VAGRMDSLLVYVCDIFLCGGTAYSGYLQLLFISVDCLFSVQSEVPCCEDKEHI